MAILSLAWKSLLNRRFTALLTVISIALSVTLLVGAERLRTEARASFANTLSGTDLIVGARSGPVQLLLYAVFRIGDATNNISWESYQDIAAHPRVDWTVPISLGDSHRGFRVLGTTAAYFEHYRYARDRRLIIDQGQPFADLYDAVLGAEVAEKLGYKIGDAIIVAHGASDVSFARHDDKPFRVVGILARTGTPVDRTVHVSLEAVEAIHVDWRSGAPIPGLSISAEQARAMDLTPKAITAVLVGLKSKIATFHVQRFINDYPEEPLSAILPGVALSQLWDLIGIAENALLIVSAFVVVVGLFGMLTALLTSLNERRREMAILRSVGARPGHVFALIMGEAGVLTLLGVLSGMTLLYLSLIVGQPIIESRFGIFIPLGGPTAYEWTLLGAVVAAGVLVGSIPSYRAYRLSLADGLSVRI
ncbi:ABC-type transport system, involved in lipoprotein release, permease component [Thioflavicoccus mobilis 8321]|uniref:ABC-type transport system, involved in lipoprotein release, permease component n=1 Tax=Thioflavicoccus mobilis 8321 TaxID=765912 RepID=L0H0R5_9GAMM|nr:ABC transporter permease [Thioflavicoccus mobilis]AGA91230.1 ABC-type transport system, involved in lipoprotein release, permease component [Thioflavicoccus mobilis 8321]